MTRTIASRLWNVKTGLTLYVSELPGEGGKDWGYTDKPAQARELSPYWQRRFNADCRRVGSEAQFFNTREKQ